MICFLLFLNKIDSTHTYSKMSSTNNSSQTLSAYSGGSIPKTVQFLRLHDDYDGPLPSLAGVHTLVLGKAYNYPFVCLPVNLHTLVLGDCYDYPLPKLTAPLHTLVLGKSYNRVLPELPDSLTILVIGSSFNQPLLGLPVDLHTLQIGDTPADAAEAYPDPTGPARKSSSFLKNVLPELPSCLATLAPAHREEVLPAPSVLPNNKPAQAEETFPLLTNDLPSIPDTLHLLSLSEQYEEMPVLPSTLDRLASPKEKSFFRMRTGESTTSPFVDHTGASLSLGEVSRQKIVPTQYPYSLPLPVLHSVGGEHYTVRRTLQLPAQLRCLRVFALTHYHFPKLGEALHTLVVGYLFSADIPPLPKSLRTLNICPSYAHPLPSLPAHLTHLRKD